MLGSLFRIVVKHHPISVYSEGRNCRTCEGMPLCGIFRYWLIKLKNVSTTEQLALLVRLIDKGIRSNILQNSGSQNMGRDPNIGREGSKNGSHQGDSNLSKRTFFFSFFKFFKFRHTLNYCIIRRGG